MKEFKVTTYLSFSVKAIVCAEDRTEAVSKAKKLLESGEIEPNRICIERESSWAYPTGCACDAHNHPPTWALEKSAKTQQDRDTSKGAQQSEPPFGAKKLMHHLLGAV